MPDICAHASIVARANTVVREKPASEKPFETNKKNVAALMLVHPMSWRVGAMDTGREIVVVGTAQSGAIATFVERKSGYLRALILTDKTAGSFTEAAAVCFTDIPVRYKHTLTLDNGSEMSQYERMERTTGLTIYFAHPYHSWERGTNENTNGLLRFYFPKSMSFAHLTQEALDVAVKELNTRPRKRLGYRTPEQVFRKKW